MKGPSRADVASKTGYAQTQSKLSRTCPKCEAKPGYKCGRWLTAGWKTISRPHKER